MLNADVDGHLGGITQVKFTDDGLYLFSGGRKVMYGLFFYSQVYSKTWCPLECLIVVRQRQEDISLCQFLLQLKIKYGFKLSRKELN